MLQIFWENTLLSKANTFFFHYHSNKGWVSFEVNKSITTLKSVKYYANKVIRSSAFAPSYHTLQT